jgi:hypothetical protein
MLKKSKDCDLSWLTKIYKCKTKNKQEIEGYSMECGVDTNLFKTKDQRCKQLYNIRYAEEASSKKATPKKTRKCKDIEELNQLTGRCRKKCNENQIRDEKTGRCKKIASRKASSRKASSRKASSRKASSRKASSRKASSRKASSRKVSSRKVSSNEFKTVEFTPYLEENDQFYNQKRIKLDFTIKGERTEKPVYDPNVEHADYRFLQKCIEHNDTESFKEFIKQNPTTDIFFYPQYETSLLTLAIDRYNQEIVDTITDLEMKYRKKGKNKCYQIYSYKYLKLLESLSTPEKPVDFYIEDWIFNENYEEHYNLFKKRLKEPMQILYYNECFWKRTNRDKYPCLYPNIRWQSGDIRKLFTDKLTRTIGSVIEGFLQYDKLYLDDFKIVLKNSLPFLHFFTKDYAYISFYIEEFINSNPILKKELSKQENKEVMLDALQKYVYDFLSIQNSQYVDQFVEMSTTNNFPTYTKGTVPNLEQLRFRYNYTELLEKKKTPKNIKQYEFCKNIKAFLDEIVRASSYVMDIYTILRMFKKNDLSANYVKPYSVYGYFGDAHVKHMIYFFIEILGGYEVIIYKPNTSCDEVDISPDKHCRCITFEPNEYLENSKEIRQLSGPVSFCRLQAINKDARPYYITLFGDDHISERGQCKECNFDYVEYNRKNVNLT